jgi:hypothetical protein
VLECPDLDLGFVALALRLLVRRGKGGVRGIGDGVFVGEVVVELEARRCWSVRAVWWKDGDVEEFLNLGRFWRALMASIERA